MIHYSLTALLLMRLLLPPLASTRWSDNFTAQFAQKRRMISPCG